MVIDQVVKQGRVQDGGRVKLFPRDRSSDHGENTRANHCTDTKGSEGPRAKRFLQGMLREFRVADQLIDRFGSEQLLPQRLGS